MWCNVPQKSSYTNTLSQSLTQNSCHVTSRHVSRLLSATKAQILPSRNRIVALQACSRRESPSPSSIKDVLLRSSRGGEWGQATARERFTRTKTQPTPSALLRTMQSSYTTEMKGETDRLKRFTSNEVQLCTLCTRPPKTQDRVKRALTFSSFHRPCGRM